MRDDRTDGGPDPRIKASRADASTATASMAVAFLAIAAILATAPAAASAAEVPVRRWGLGLEGGVLKLQEGAWDYAAADQFGRVRLSRGLGRNWGLNAAWLWGHSRSGVVERGAESGWSFAAEPPYYTLLSQPMLELEHRLSPGAFVSPLLTVGVGVTSWRVVRPGADGDAWFPSGETVTGRNLDGDAVELSGANPTFSFGLGFDVSLSRALHLGFGARYQLLQGNDRDNVGLSADWGAEHVDANTALTGAWAALTWWTGSSDADGDGVPDDRDACPELREDVDGFNDGDGCPDPDNDGDGIADGRDLCPQLAEDHDGYRDDDGCPEIDNDGDGIPDGRDRCPDQAEDVDGDADGDGCPDLDSDGDGVADDRDRCPGTEADSLVDAEGCPVPVPVSGDVAVHSPLAPPDYVLEGVAFASGSAQLTPAARVQLEEAAAWLAGEPGSVEIRGHTDSAGDAVANRDLSLRRADAVRDALVALGLPASRFTTAGSGEDAPVADNATVEGRARNRRVEIRLQR